MDDYSYSKGLEDRAVARRAAQANGQALSEKVAELAYARPMADAARLVAVVWDRDERGFHVWENWPELADALNLLVDVHRATTPSQVPSSHVIVERAELERLRAVVGAALESLDGRKDSHNELARVLAELGAGA